MMSLDEYLMIPKLDRIRLIKETGDSEILKITLARNLMISIEEFESLYSVDLKVIKRYVTISGSPSDIYSVFHVLNKLGVNFHSLTESNIVVDIDHLMYKLV